ncbi:N-acetyltransferase [Thalassobaculum fulvum]|uniref:N-acetyltransferase n=1 Tax=Thalassobaculum fulvum TaxID=1633335 RepID=A0A918XT99_9PROT|nr:GNAT family N-acetyltransferase [Thalassobaculum fulvum]GHD54416.1 N-acetyltransferase [Thalassobaculum fulvum]
MTIELRPAVAADATTLLDLIRRLAEAQDAADYVESTVDDLLRDGFGPAPRFHALLAEAVDPASGRRDAIGLALYYFTYSTWAGRPNLYIEDLYVDPDRRGDGIGRRLVAALARAAVDGGCARLELAVKTDNRAREFYERLGMVRKGTWLPYAIADDALRTLAGTAT